MKRLLLICVALALLLTACTSEKDFFGVWYVDEGGTRNVIQFSESNDGENAFIWAVYDIENDEIVSIAKGYFKADNKQIVLTYIEDNTQLELTYKLDGEQLTLSSETASMVLSKYE